MKIDSAIFTQVTTQCPYNLLWAPLSPKISPSHWGSGPHLTRFLWPIQAHNPKDISFGSAVLAQMTVECPYTLQRDAPFYSKLPVPWAHPSLQPKWHLDRFSRFCRAH